MKTESEFEDYLMGQGHLHFVLGTGQAIYITEPCPIARDSVY